MLGIIGAIDEEVAQLNAKETLVQKSRAGNDFLGRINLPVNYDKEEFARVKSAAEKIK